MSNTRVERIEAVAADYVSAQKYAGIEWRVEAHGEVFSEGTVGCADVATGRAIPEDAIYRIYSMTKPIVSVLALILMEQGKLRLFDMLQQFDPRFAQMQVLTAQGQIQPAQRPILVEDLLTHRAGFTYEFIHGCHIAPYYREARVIEDGGRSLDEMMGALALLPLAFQPGSQFRYGVCTDVLAHVCEIAGGAPLRELLQRHIFVPLSMSKTDFGVAAENRSALMPMYGVGDLAGVPSLQPLPQELVPMDVESMYPSDAADRFARGGHGLFSTSSDYLAFARMLLDGRNQDGEVILSRKSLEMLQLNRIPSHQLPLTIGPAVLAGYGWGLIGRVMLDRGASLSLSGEGEFGWAGAASTYFWVDPKEYVVGVVMTQYLGASLPLADDMRAAIYQAID